MNNRAKRRYTFLFFSFSQPVQSQKLVIRDSLNDSARLYPQVGPGYIQSLIVPTHHSLSSSPDISRRVDNSRRVWLTLFGTDPYTETLNP